MFKKVRNKLLKYDEYSEEIDKLNEEISSIEAKSNRDKIVQNFQSYSQDPENINLANVWKTLDKLWPKCGESLPTAKKNHKGLFGTK